MAGNEKPYFRGAQVSESEAPLLGELPRLKTGLDPLVAWFRIGEE